MTRQEFRDMFITHNPPKKRFRRPTRLDHPSQTDPSFAMSGAQIFQSVLVGKPIASPIGLEYQNAKLDDITPFDTQIKERLNVLQYTKEELNQIEFQAKKAHQQMLEQIAKEKQTALENAE